CVRSGNSMFDFW
nr:immunoglobulin heavy chain junction region [Macaca mulatta]